jgi:hypothetical protein
MRCRCRVSSLLLVKGCLPRPRRSGTRMGNLSRARAVKTRQGHNHCRETEHSSPCASVQSLALNSRLDLYEATKTS